MGETRKQLIEMLEPYMDKTLSDGCYIKHKCPITKRIIISIYYGDVDEHKDYCYRTWKEKKILGHYDITAVLKYILDDGTTRELLNINYTKEYIIFQYKGIDVNIPNKPLHLYTEQEEKELLTLLKQLGK